MYSSGIINQQQCDILRVSFVAACYTNTHAIMGLNYCQVKVIFVFLQPPCCYFTLYKELLSQSFVLFENLLPHIIVPFSCANLMRSMTYGFVCSVLILRCHLTLKAEGDYMYQPL
jgi:hypothetical protein